MIFLTFNKPALDRIEPTAHPWVGDPVPRTRPDPDRGRPPAWNQRGSLTVGRSRTRRSPVGLLHRLWPPRGSHRGSYRFNRGMTED
jgi:hypothetical protein